MSVVTLLDPTPEQEALRGLVRDFAEAEIAPHAEAWDRDHTFPVDTVKQMGALGLFGLPFPEEYGGGGGDLTTLCIAIEEIAKRWPHLEVDEAGLRRVHMSNVAGYSNVPVRVSRAS